MRVIISPAKKMRVDTDTFVCNDLPALLPKAEVLMKYIQGFSYAEQKALWACNDKIAQENAERFADMDLREGLVLVYAEEHEDRHEALSREWHIKRMSREEKMKLVKGRND